MLFKENAVVVPAVLIVHDLLRRPSRSAAVWLARAVPYAAALAVYAASGSALGAPRRRWRPTDAADRVDAVGLALSRVMSGRAWSPSAGLLGAVLAAGASRIPASSSGRARRYAMAVRGVVGRRRLPELTSPPALFALPLAPAAYLRGLNQGDRAAVRGAVSHLPSRGGARRGIGVEALRRRGGGSAAGTAIAARRCLSAP